MNFTRSRWRWTLLLVLGLTAACDDSTEPAPDVEQDVSADTTDTAPDAGGDAETDTEPDVAPDAEPDVAPDAEPDVAPDAEPDVVVPPLPDFLNMRSLTAATGGQAASDSYRITFTVGESVPPAANGSHQLNAPPTTEE